MSYEDTNCPCGGKKEPQTMLCNECVVAFADRRELRTYQDPREPPDIRRHACIILLALAHKRRNPLRELDEFIARKHKRKI